MLFSECLLIVSSVASAPSILLTQDMVTPSLQQAVGSSVSAVVIFMGPHGVPFWSYEWKIKHAAGDVSCCFLFKRFSINEINVNFKSLLVQETAQNINS